jgi:hypothetical protein
VQQAQEDHPEMCMSKDWVMLLHNNFPAYVVAYTEATGQT